MRLSNTYSRTCLLPAPKIIIGFYFTNSLLTKDYIPCI